LDDWLALQNLVDSLVLAGITQSRHWTSQRDPGLVKRSASFEP
jgi:hypothetical protein